MTSEEARLCCTRDLTDSHMDWIIAKFSLQSESIANRITTIEPFYQRRVISRSIKPTRIVLIQNVEKKKLTCFSSTQNSPIHQVMLKTKFEDFWPVMVFLSLSIYLCFCLLLLVICFLCVCTGWAKRGAVWKATILKLYIRFNSYLGIMLYINPKTLCPKMN